MSPRKSFDRSILAVTLSLFAALAGCSGAEGAAPADPNVQDASDPGDNDDDGNDPAPDPRADAGDAGSDPPKLPRQCEAKAGKGPLVCLETMEGKAGDIVQLEVHLAGSAMCPVAQQAYGRIDFDKSHFVLVNPVSHVDCTTRDVIPDFNDPSKDQIVWQKFGGGAIAGCDENISMGKVDAIQIRIKPGTPPGDYDFTWETAEFAGLTQECYVQDEFVSAKLRVLP